ncbi:MAG: phosphoglucosamine mutase [Betaproteobacteria bacterium]|nr:MAG: phosphoglucosamine mutase [Betaproteobacteria bacterium]
MTKRKYFGTDGVRGRVGVAPITPDFALKLGYAAGCVLVGQRADGSRPMVLIGKDTRVSGYMLESALEAGFTAAGVDVRLVGPMPTPAVAYLTRALRLSAGVVISASHNPFEDNGIKFFSGDGFKLPDAVELAIEAAIDQPIVTVDARRIGKVKRLDDAAGRYIEFCKSTFPFDLDLRGMTIVVDCAHGATYHVAPPVLHELGAEVIAIGNAPDGFNINDGCGATHPQAMVDAVRANGADLGVALDGDGDRLIMCDADGQIVDGDQLLYAMAKSRLAAGEAVPGVVGTLMTNGGVEQALRALGLDFERAHVGDRYVLERLQARGWVLGGEGSGHLLCLDRHSTGDGIVSALQVLAAIRRTGQTLADLVVDCALWPQVLINIKAPRELAQHAEVVAAAAAEEVAFAGRGRILLRASGTEPLVRVMVEGQEADAVHAAAERVAAVVRRLLAG